jgi:hypothetical protein
MRRHGLTTVFAFGAFLLALPQVLVLWPAAAGVPLWRPLSVCIAVASIAGAAWLASRFNEAGPHDTPPEDRDASPAASAAAWLAVGASLAWTMWQWIRLWRLTWLRPVYDWDGLYYHVPALHGWAMAHRVRWIPGMDDLPFVNGYPMAVEALGFLVHRLGGTSRLVDAGNLFYWPLAAVALTVIASELGARGPWRWVPAGLLGTIPTWVILSGTCYVDPAFAACVIAGLAAALMFARAAEAGATRHALLFGTCGGLMIGAKGQGAAFFAVMLAAVLIARARGPGDPVPNGRGRGARLLAHAALALVAAFAVGGYWSLRDLLMTGNPIFPIQLSIGAKVLVPGYDTVALLQGNMPAWLRAWPAAVRVPVAWLELDAPIRGFAATGGLGLVWLIAALPAVAIAWLLVMRGVATRRPLVMSTLLVVVLLAIQPAPWWARMTLWLHALGLPCIGFVFHEASRARSRPAAFLVPVALIALLAVGARESRDALDAEWASGRLAAPSPDGALYRTSAEAVFPGLESQCAAFMDSPRIARGPWSRFGTLLGGVLAQPLEMRDIVTIGAQVDSLTIDRLRKNRIEWVVWDEVRSGPLPAALREITLESCAYRPNADQRFLMARIAGIARPVPPSPTSGTGDGP